FYKLTSTTTLFKLLSKSSQPVRPVLMPDKQPAEGSFIQGHVHRIFKTGLPVGDQLECFQHLRRVTHQTKMAGDSSRVSGQQIFLGKPVIREVGAEVA